MKPIILFLKKKNGMVPVIFFFLCSLIQIKNEAVAKEMPPMSQRDREGLVRQIMELQERLNSASLLGDDPEVLESIQDEITRLTSIVESEGDVFSGKKRKDVPAAARAGEGNRRPMVRTMGTVEIQHEVAMIMSMEPKERSKNSPRLKALNSELEKRAGENASGGAGGGAGSGSSKPKIHGRAILVEISSDDEEEDHHPPVKKLMNNSSAGEFVFEIDDSSDEGAGSGAAVVEETEEEEEEAVDFERGAGEDVLEYLARLMKARVRMSKVVTSLENAVNSAEEKIANERASFEDKKADAMARAEANPTATTQKEREQYILAEFENENREMVPTKLALHEKKIRELTGLVQEARTAHSTKVDQLDVLNTRVQNLMVSKDVRRAFMTKYKDMTQTEAKEAFETEFQVNSFGRRRVVGLLAFFGNYRRKHPRIRARKIVGKYVRALTLFG